MRRASNSFVCAVDQLELLRLSLFGRWACVVVVGAFVRHPANATTRDIAPIICIKPPWSRPLCAASKEKNFICKKHRARKRLRSYISTASAGLALIRNP
ncbi:unnamed protein product [Trichogramma brassicae]|uniref:Uncharacterized protein n=1 Tax=Trichogramma brassicae TaxID=86971 RepID=A0A6H5I9C6_9HYME|nr:unnamed protein product [Trichogramma brassicae]